MALLLFSFYLQLVISRSREALQLLLLIGYSPRWLSRNVSRRFVPVYVLVVLAALAVTQLMQWAFNRYVMFGRQEIGALLHWAVILLAAMLVVLSVITNYRLVKKQVSRLL
jgi:hypothetical protein